ncbi:MAG: alginate lyase family protein [Opitutales bacterium]|nr:alginate lyase family protein [Opitutales bacterium]MDP4645104.1 alginate lyase family protein [Opitutales bacterium]
MKKVQLFALILFAVIGIILVSILRQKETPVIISEEPAPPVTVVEDVAPPVQPVEVMVPVVPVEQPEETVAPVVTSIPFEERAKQRFITLTDTKGRQIVVEVIDVAEDSLRVVRKSELREITLAVNLLTETDQSFAKYLYEQKSKEATTQRADVSGFPSRSSTQGFIHPGILHREEDLLRMRQQVAAGVEPWASGFASLRDHSQSSSDYEVRGGFEETGRKPSVRSSEHESDANAAYQNAMMWTITGEKAHAKKAIEIINAWSGKLEKITGRDAILSAGISGVKFVAAAEILRHTNSGWSERDILKAEDMFKNVYYPVCKDMADFANGNWALAALQTVMAIAVFTDDQVMFDRAVKWFHRGKDNARLTHYVINEDGQCQESGRDQQHTMLGLGYLSVVAEIGWNQGLDLYGAEDNRILAGFEYTASYNLGNEVPFEETIDTTGKYRHKAISEEGRGDFSRRPIFEMVYYHYKVRRGLECPFTEQVVLKMRPEGPGFKGDHFGFGTVLFAR